MGVLTADYNFFWFGFVLCFVLFPLLHSFENFNFRVKDIDFILGGFFWGGGGGGGVLGGGGGTRVKQLGGVCVKEG